MMKNKTLIGLLLVWWGIFTGRAENMVPIHEDTFAVLTNDVNDKYTQVLYLCYLSLGLLLLCLIFHFYKNRIRLQTELEYERKHLKEVEKLNQYRLRFFTNISHEFRTPLSVIIGQMELLLQIRSFSPAIYNRILSMYKSSTQLQSLINELLDFRKQELGYMKIRVIRCDMVAFLKESFLVFEEYAQKNKVQLRFETSEETIDMFFDVKQMQKVVNNLLSNAIKYTPEGGTVILSINKEVENIVISVKDTGKGIKPEDLMHIFDSFYQSQDAVGGTGIGLALAKGIVELHGGTIGVESNVGEGSIFTFSLPLGCAHYRQEDIMEERQTVLMEHVDAFLREETVMPQNEVDKVVTGIKPTFKLLIVEDDDELRVMLADIFTPFYIVEQASDGNDGWNKINDFQPDIVVSDVLMPVMSGIELCRRVKTNVNTSHIPVVLLTARTAIEHELEGLKFGADDYIVKPFNVNILLARCRNLIKLRIAIQEQYTGEPQTNIQALALSPLDQEFIDKAKAIIEENLSNTEFNISVLIREMGVSRTLLFNKLKAVTGQSPNDFITTIRLREAACLLKKHPEWNVTEISEKTGFNSVGYFSRVFKERFKMTPSDYRHGKNSGKNEISSALGL